MRPGGPAPLGGVGLLPANRRRHVRLRLPGKRDGAKAGASRRTGCGAFDNDVKRLRDEQAKCPLAYRRISNGTVLLGSCTALGYRERHCHCWPPRRPPRLGRFSMSTAQPPIAPDDADRSTRLMVAGTLACLCGLFAVMMAALNMSTLGHPRGHVMNTPADIKSTLFCLLAAVAFVWIGIGLAKARRWAWTLTVVLSWMWLIFGVLGFATVMFFMSQMKDEAIGQHGEAEVASSGAMTAMMISVGVFGACITVLMPAVFLMLCHSKSVRALVGKEIQRPAGPTAVRCRCLP